MRCEQLEACPAVDKIFFLVTVAESFGSEALTSVERCRRRQAAVELGPGMKVSEVELAFSFPFPLYNPNMV